MVADSERLGYVVCNEDRGDLILRTQAEELLLASPDAVIGSNAPKGSSNSSKPGEAASARATATRWR